MFDYVTCELPLPDGRHVPKDSFQTKSLWCSMDLFTITASGRLIFHKRRYYLFSEANSRPPEHICDLDMNYHGDIKILGTAKDGSLACYAVRFTHGTVEWIRSFEQLPELHRIWLTERGAIVQ